MKTKLPNFDVLREQLCFDRVLEHYGIELQPTLKNPHQLGGSCPLPNHGEDRTKKQFSVNTTMKVFHCFGCGASGSILDFIALMQGKDPLVGLELREGLLTVSEQLLATSSTSFVNEDASLPTPPVKTEAELPVLVNAPLDFALKLDPGHESLTNSLGLAKPTIERFGLGYCQRGKFASRIAAPLHLPGGSIVGYCGVEFDESSPQYLWPDDERVREEVCYRFDRSAFLYNGQRFFGQPPVDRLIVTPHLIELWRLEQSLCKSKVPYCVSTMGETLSQAQEDLISQILNPEHGEILLAVLPEHEAFAHKVVAQLSRRHFCRWATVDELLA